MNNSNLYSPKSDTPRCKMLYKKHTPAVINVIFPDVCDRINLRKNCSYRTEFNANALPIATKISPNKISATTKLMPES